MKRNSTFLSRAILILLGLSVVASGRTRAGEDPSNPDKSNGVNVLVIGHSLTGNLQALPFFAPGIGHPDHKQQHYLILGAGVRWHYERMTEEMRKKFFESGMKLDALIMSARDLYQNGDVEFAPKFAAEAFRNNPKCQIFIYGNWPTPGENFEKPTIGRSEAHIENVGAAVDKAFPEAPKTRMMPCSLVFREIGRLADRGELPGVTSHYQLYSDGDHPSQVAAYAINLLVMCMLYNEPPWSYPTDIYPKDNTGKRGASPWSIKVSEDTAAVIKRVVWDVLQTYPPAGMPPGLVIANRHLEPAIAGQPYKVELKALNANGPCTWSITKGSLPSGISLSKQGVVSGKSSLVGNHPITITLTDGRKSFARDLVVSVNSDTLPAIPEQPLASVSLDEYVQHPLKALGGVGAITWSLSGGQLPYGIMLAPSGMLVGTPGEEGAFTFKIKAADSYPTGSRSAEREFQWKIGPAKPDTLLVKYVVAAGTDITRLADIQADWGMAKADEYVKKFAIPEGSVIKIDGKLDEPFWKLDQPIEKKAKGTPTKKASFAAVWTASSDGNGDPKQILPGKLYVGTTPGRTWKLSGSDLVLAVKVLDGSKGKTPKDGVHIFIDGNHDKTLIYSSDDTHFFIPRDLKGRNAQTICGKVNWFTDAKVQEIDGGYVMEIKLGGNNYFGGAGNWIPFGFRGGYGFDLAVDEGEEGNVSQQVWRGDAKDDTDTSHFGTIVLTGQPAIEKNP